ncbi:hypothetical protein B9Q03_13850 [Candidatus Marsarchaeota G2 archaeon OSP_D]|uniref:Uncharacterized protein n=1 Tax=Candidatus Marsarchaeota G2 archaeon OSP_D TaxID=1978157 RepID=A0A2R6A901_9ARCH|nr:MAG: hypothetical protein B9Q03_13850 [Candidatus Marsarchaeota G2 archaeon OSP_D]
MCVRVPLPQPASGGLGSLSATTHPTAHAQPDHSNPEIHINLSILELLTTTQLSPKHACGRRHTLLFQKEKSGKH